MCFRSLKFFSDHSEGENIPLLDIVIEEKQRVLVHEDLLKEILQKLDWRSIIQLSQVDKFSKKVIQKCLNESLLISDLLEEYIRTDRELKKTITHERLTSFKRLILFFLFFEAQLSLLIELCLVLFGEERQTDFFLIPIIALLPALMISVYFSSSCLVNDKERNSDELKGHLNLVSEVMKDKVNKLEFVPRKLLQ